MLGGAVDNIAGQCCVFFCQTAAGTILPGELLFLVVAVELD